ncbi:hypothetical protein PHET_06329 [Paragonimus heterotremus]|uniref:Uncharacterized protein n=1 Tax=Paragonimus heterotremus TaxID=100268 RepID=A0A8J4SP74_9TREM|nr:hypothetical protein PHET_06329 [Paragonimus heterotremus]
MWNYLRGSPEQELPSTVMKCYLTFMDDPSCSYVSSAVADNDVVIVPVATTTATSVEGPLTRRRISRRVLRPWEQYVAVDRPRTIRDGLASSFQQSPTGVIHQSMSLDVPQSIAHFFLGTQGRWWALLGNAVSGTFAPLFTYLLDQRRCYCAISYGIAREIDLVPRCRIPLRCVGNTSVTYFGAHRFPFKKEPLIVGVYCGPSKPSSFAEFLLGCINKTPSLTARWSATHTESHNAVQPAKCYP